MIVSLNALIAVRAEFDNSSGIFLVDLPLGKVYALSGLEVQEEIRNAVISKIEGKEEEIPEIPYAEIYDVINTEKKIQEENNKHIFRRNSE